MKNRIILARKKVKNGYIAFCYCSGKVDPYITWFMDHQGNMSLGQYFTNFEDALISYRNRQ